MAINVQKLIQSFKSFCFDIEGKLEEKYPVYLCLVSNKNSDKYEKYYFEINVFDRNRVPLRIVGYRYNIKKAKLKTNSVSLAYLGSIKRHNKKVYEFISLYPQVSIEVRKEKNIELYLKVSGVTVENKTPKLYSYEYNIELLPKIEGKDMYNILIPESCQDKEKGTECTYVSLDHFYFYTNKKTGYLSLRSGFSYLETKDPEYLQILAISKDFEYVELNKIDKVLMEYKGLLHFIEVYKKLIEKIPEDIKKLRENNWEIILYSSQSDIAKYLDLPASGVADPNKKRIYISLGRIIHYNKQELMEDMLHEIKHALLRIEGKSPEGYWEYEEGKFIPYGEEKEATEYAKVIAKTIAKQ